VPSEAKSDRDARATGREKKAAKQGVERLEGQARAAANAVATIKTGDRASGLGVLFLQLGQVGQQFVLFR
jgi:hypothetical protein